MLRSRIIPCLLVHKGGLVKTKQFKDSKYVGDPINAVKIFNEKEVDELIVLDIDASRNNKEPDFNLIKNLAIECRMPFCYGGGVKSVEHAKKIIQLGAEKVAISSAAIENINLISEIGKAVGVQSVVIVIDVRRKKTLFTEKIEICTLNATKISKYTLEDFIRELEKIGVGEIVINSIDRDGMMNGFDIDLIDTVRNLCTCPITVLGGAGKPEDFSLVINKYKIIGVSAGSYFVFKGIHRAVLINYFDKETRRNIEQNKNL